MSSMTETQYSKDLNTDCHQVHIIPVYLKPNLLKLNQTMSTTTQRQAGALACMHTRAHQMQKTIIFTTYNRYLEMQDWNNV